MGEGGGGAKGVGGCGSVVWVRVGVGVWDKEIPALNQGLNAQGHHIHVMPFQL